MQKIVISTEVAGFVPEYSLLKGLLLAHPEAFDEPFEAEEFGINPSMGELEVARHCAAGVLVGRHLYFLRRETWVRSLPWLVAEVERRRGRNCTWRGGSAKVVEVPLGVRWYLSEAEDGSESIHEEHRVWS